MRLGRDVVSGLEEFIRSERTRTLHERMYEKEQAEIWYGIMRMLSGDWTRSTWLKAVCGQERKR